MDNIKEMKRQKCVSDKSLVFRIKNHYINKKTTELKNGQRI